MRNANRYSSWPWNCLKVVYVHARAALLASALAGIAWGQQTLTASPNPVTYGQPLTLTLCCFAVTAEGSTVYFDEDIHGAYVSLGTATLAAGANRSSQATLTVTSLSAGSHALAAFCCNNGTSGTPSTTTVSVDKAPTSTQGGYYAPGPPIYYGEAVGPFAKIYRSDTQQPATGATGTVTFSEGNTTLATASVSNGMASSNISSLAVGTHVVNFSYSGDANFSASQDPLVADITIVAVPTTTVLTAAPNPYTILSGSVTFTAAVSPSPMAEITVVGGSVAFKCWSATIL